MSSEHTIRGRIEFLVPASQGGEHLITLDFVTKEELKDVLTYAQAHNFKPRFFGPSVANGSQSPTSTSGSQASPPTCPLHKTPMKLSKQKSGGYYCPKKDGERYCRNRSLDGVTIHQVD